jgi:hypothetical protein
MCEVATGGLGITPIGDGVVDVVTSIGHLR